MQEQVPQVFGALLRRLRRRAGLTQEALAERAGVSARTISDLERGTNTAPRIETSRLLADALALTGLARSAFEASAEGVELLGMGSSEDNETYGLRSGKTLPRDVPSFVGRSAEYEMITDSLRTAENSPGATKICLITGMAGVGKTTIAVHAAHQLASAFPDGQYYVSLYGHTPARRPLDVGEALAGVLMALGMPTTRIPVGQDNRARLWRGLLADKAVLLVLDDALDYEQVEPLLPASAKSAVLITCRHHMPGLFDARTVGLDTLKSQDSVNLLVRLADREDLTKADEHLRAIASLCGDLPLALAMVARQLHHHPAWSAAHVASDLRSAYNRLSIIEGRDSSVTAAFDLSYERLGGSTRQLFRRLALHPGTDIDAHAARALADTDLTEVQSQLEELYEQHLLQESVRGRYRLHDLLKLHAADLVQEDDPPSRNAAVERLLNYYTTVAAQAGVHLTRQTVRGIPLHDAPPAHALAIHDADSGAVWFDHERHNLQAMGNWANGHGRPDGPIVIARSLHAFLRGRGYWDQALAVHATALQAARRSRNDQAEGEALANIADIQYLNDEYATAKLNLEEALAVLRRTPDRHTEAVALQRMGALIYRMGDWDSALTTLNAAIALSREVEDLAGEAYAASFMGSVLYLKGNLDSAHTQLTYAHSIHDRLGDRFGQVGDLNYLGAVELAANRPEIAITVLESSLRLANQVGYKLGEAYARIFLSRAFQGTADLTKAETSIASAVKLCRELGDRAGEAESLLAQGDLEIIRNRESAAIDCYTTARTIAVRISAIYVEAQAVERLGAIDIANGNRRLGEQRLDHAYLIYAQVGSPLAEPIVRRSTDPML